MHAPMLPVTVWLVALQLVPRFTSGHKQLLLHLPAAVPNVYGTIASC